MSLSRGVSLFKVLKNSPNLKTSVRHSGHGPAPAYYRRSGCEDTPKWSTYGRDIMIGFATWWVVWHIWHEPGHIVGEFDYPDPSKWTDAELGIPPDDVD